LTVFNCTLGTVPTQGDRFAAFRAQIQRRREELGLNYGEAAQRAGITGQRWRTIEIGYETKGGVQIPANPRRSNIIKMARAVEIPIEDALRLAGEEPLRRVEAQQLSERPRDELKAIINELPEDQIRALLHVAQTMQSPPTNHPATGRGRRIKPGAGEIPSQREDRSGGDL
jgi:transcriptional regulator with XRE-family HTH domain